MKISKNQAQRLQRIKRRLDASPRRPTGSPLARFLCGRRNTLASGCGLIALGLYSIGTVAGAWPYAVASAYGVGYILGGMIPPRRHQVALLDPDADDLDQQLEEMISEIQDRLPDAVIAPVAEIKELVVALLPRLDTVSSLDESTYVIRQTASTYLPHLLGTYLRLPTQYAQNHRLPNGVTPVEVLVEQLDLLLHELKEIQAKLHQNDIRALLAHGRFLKEKFGRGNYDWLG